MAGRFAPGPDCALVVLDMINTFDFPNGGRLRAAALRIAPAVARLRTRVLRAGGACVFANDSFGHWRHGLEEVVASARGDRGAAVLELLAPGPDDRFVLKPRHSAFHGTALATVLDELGARRLVLAGIAAEACVLATAFAAHMRDCPVWVPRGCRRRSRCCRPGVWPRVAPVPDRRRRRRPTARPGPRRCRRRRPAAA